MNNRMPKAYQIAMFQALHKEMEEMRQKNIEEVTLRRKNEEEV